MQDYRMRLPLSIAVAQPRCVPGPANGRGHARAARLARRPPARRRADRGVSRAVADRIRARRRPGRAGRRRAGAHRRGVPVHRIRGAGRRSDPWPPGQAHIAMLAVSPDGVAVLYRKQWIGGDEAARFSPGDEPAVTEVDGWRIGVGICRDTGIGAHVEQMAALDIDVYVAGLVHRADELSEQERRAVSIAGRCRAYVAFASFAGPAGGGYQQTAGSSAIWSPAGDVLAQAGTIPGDLVRATLE